MNVLCTIEFLGDKKAKLSVSTVKSIENDGFVNIGEVLKERIIELTESQTKSYGIRFNGVSWFYSESTSEITIANTVINL